MNCLRTNSNMKNAEQLSPKPYCPCQEGFPSQHRGPLLKYHVLLCSSLITPSGLSIKVSVILVSPHWPLQILDTWILQLSTYHHIILWGNFSCVWFNRISAKFPEVQPYQEDSRSTQDHYRSPQWLSMRGGSDPVLKALQSTISQANMIEIHRAWNYGLDCL